MKQLSSKAVIHRNQPYWAIDFEYDSKLIAEIKKLAGTRWSKTHNSWLVLPTEKNRKALRAIFGLPEEGKLIIKLPALSSLKPEVAAPNKVQQLAVAAYTETLRLRNYSDNTIKNYRNHFIPFVLWFEHKKPSQVTKNEILDYLVMLRRKENWSATLQNQKINAIKFFYEQVLKYPKEVYDLPRAKKPFILPTVFSEDELRRIILCTENLKHRTILCLAYAAGLRVSEITNLKQVDIDNSRMVITLRQAKGKKDRQVMLSTTLLNLLREYYRLEKIKPMVYLFEGPGASKYSIRSVEQIMKNAKAKAGVKKRGSIHAIRHSFATHLLEGGTDIFTIKDLLGHSSISTTSIYAHVSKKHIGKVQSPLDKLGL